MRATAAGETIRSTRIAGGVVQYVILSAGCALKTIGSKAGGAPVIAVEAACSITELGSIQADR